jgi:hypothetical protein
LTRRANQWHIDIIAKIDEARAEKSAAGFFVGVFEPGTPDRGACGHRPDNPDQPVPPPQVSLSCCQASRISPEPRDDFPITRKKI